MTRMGETNAACATRADVPVLNARGGGMPGVGVCLKEIAKGGGGLRPHPRCVDPARVAGV